MKELVDEDDGAVRSEKINKKKQKIEDLEGDNSVIIFILF